MLLLPIGCFPFNSQLNSQHQLRKSGVCDGDVTEDVFPKLLYSGCFVAVKRVFCSLRVYPGSDPLFASVDYSSLFFVAFLRWRSVGGLDCLTDRLTTTFFVYGISFVLI